VLLHEFLRLQLVEIAFVGQSEEQGIGAEIGRWFFLVVRNEVVRIGLAEVGENDVVFREGVFGFFAHASSPMVTRKTSSSVVIPEMALRRPSSRKVRMPFSRAFLRSSVEGAASKIIFWISSVITTISKMPRRPL